MNSFDYYTGEPSYDGSPPSPPQNMSEQEIVNNANLMYDVDPNTRYRQIQQQQMMYQQPYYGYQQQPLYYGQQPMPIQGQQFMNPPSGFSGYAGNPAYAYIQNNQQYQQYGYGYQQQPYYGYYQQPYYRPQVEDQVYHVEGYRPGGSKMILQDDAEEVCNELQMQMIQEMDQDYERRLDQYRRIYSSQAQTNYYGMPTYSVQYYNPAIENKYRQQIEQMRREAEQTRTDLNKHLSRLCHNYLNDGVDDETIDAIYDGYTVIIPGSHIEESMEYQRFANATPVEDPAYRYQAAAAAASLEYKKYVTDDMTMNEFFEALGPIRTDEMLEEERHRRRDLSSISMPTATYRELIMQKAQENAAKENQDPIFTLPQMSQSTALTLQNNALNSGQFPVLSQNAKLLDDGTLTVTAPDWLGNRTMVIPNQFEDEYEAHRRDFVNSIYGTENPYIGGMSNGSG